MNPTLTVCFLCGEDTGEIALLGAAYKGQGPAPMRMCINHDPCKACQERMQTGTILVSVRTARNAADRENPHRTGAMIVIKDEAAKRIFGDAIGNSKFAFVDDEFWDKVGFPRGPVEGVPNKILENADPEPAKGDGDEVSDS